jgi:ElaB/YqjD/DUF883 family membrane-anchored ribosome-binding protein
MGEAAGQVTGPDGRLEGDPGWDSETPDEEDPQVQQLVADIEDTRGEMTTTVDEIGQRLAPRNVVAAAKETVREATVGKVEEMANTAGAMIEDAGQTAQQAGSGLLETVRRNPVPAAMIGLGIGWLVVNNRSVATGPRMAARDAVWSAQQTAGDVTDRIGQAAGDVGSQVQQTATQVPRQVEDVARQVGDNASRVFQDNPLAVGAIAAAVGAGIGLALPATQTERQVLGQARDDMVERAESAASQALDEAEYKARQG